VDQKIQFRSETSAAFAIAPLPPLNVANILPFTAPLQLSSGFTRVQTTNMIGKPPCRRSDREIGKYCRKIKRKIER
jgi:hypothetical protein